MFNKEKGTTASIISIAVFIGCCAVMIANFNLWYLPLAALPFMIYFNIGYKGSWDSKKLDDAAIRSQDDEPYSRTWPFNVLEAEPADSQRQEMQHKLEKREKRIAEYQRMRAERDEYHNEYKQHPPTMQA